MSSGTRRAIALATALMCVGVGASAAGAQTNGGGDSASAPGQATAAANCENVWGTLQADLRAGGGPKSGPSSGPIGDYPDGSGPTNCDHFWQLQGAIGNGG
jgi:hypothetical protein